ncbi:glycine C-acetyltransferase [Candidatus Micrarchaeota archaeon]|nr:MAG: glycine C-acetyltransferase [Candidatus Micrarchaeota archaeon]
MANRNPTAFLKQEYDELVQKSLDWKIKVLMGPSSPRAEVDDKEVIMLCSNNYLGLSDHPTLKEAAIEAVKKYGAGSGSVRPIAGTMDLHVELEKSIAKYKHAEASLYYQTGFTANSGLIPQLAGKGDLIISDELNHGSIIDGVRLSKAERAIYKHCNMEDLARVLEEAEKKEEPPRRILIITDGVFSMDGDIAPMDEIVKLAQKHGAMSYVDDAHGDGVLGDHGRGISSHFDIEGKVDVEMGTFSKAFGVVGGYISGSEDLCKFALNKSRTWLLTGSHPPAVVAACRAAVELLDKDDTLVKKMWENTKYFKKGLKDMGYDIGNSQTPITPAIVGESSIAKQLSEALFEQGVFALPIVFPMVARDKARIRTMITAAHEKEHLDSALSAFETCGKKLKII